MNDLVSELLSRSTKNGRFDRNLFTREQCATNPRDRFTYRRSPEIVSAYFGFSIPAEIETDYYFWDTTTLSMVDPLSNLSSNCTNILEVGCGPPATLSVYLAKHGVGLKLTCVDINPAFLKSAETVARHNGAPIAFFESDMMTSVKPRKFDLVFMNPPYLPQENTRQLEISPNDSEFGCGDGGGDGTFVIRKFLEQAPSVLAKNGTAVLGINTRHLRDSIVVSEIERCGFWKMQRYFDQSSAQPNGPFAQVYLLHV
jgi:methylase of polypeptide subunit release factors